jgi:hypothetical protein
MAVKVAKKTEVTMTAKRLNASKTFSRILRFVDFDIPSGVSVIMNGGLINKISYADLGKLLSLAEYSKGHARQISEHTFVIDRWIYDAIKNSRGL